MTDIVELELIQGEQVELELIQGEQVELEVEGQGGVSNYPYLTNKPKIEGVTLEGDKTFDELGLTPVGTEQIDRWLFGD